MQQAQQPQGRGAAPQGRGGAPEVRGSGFNRIPILEIPPELNYETVWVLDEPKLIALLKSPSSSQYQKAMACKKLAQIGTKASIAPLAALLGDQRLGAYARFGLEPNPDPSVDDALRAALPKLNGLLQVGVIHSIGVRKDAKALDAVSKLISSSDPEVAKAAAAATGMIGGVQAARLLRDALGRTKPPVFPVVARAALLCADRMLAANRTQAIEMYNALSANSMPQPVRLAAIRALDAALGAPTA